MGKIIKKPKVPKVVVQDVDNNEQENTNDDGSQDRQRRAAIAENDAEKKGRESLVNTSFQGVLKDVNDYRPLRKTLLGE